MVKTEQDSSQEIQAAIKVPTMIIMFAMTMFFGLLPLKLKAFKENKLVLAIANAFSGGLFLSVGILHLLPEAAESFEKYFDGDDDDHDEHDHNNKTHGHGGDEDEQFPWAFLITVLSFALILFIEKIATDHHHSHGEDSHLNSARQSFQKEIKSDNEDGVSMQKDFVKDQPKINEQLIENQYNQEDEAILEMNDDDIQDELIRDTLNTKQKLARSFSQQEIRKSMGNEKIDFTPYLLQIAIGIHAVFEGIAIGIQTNWTSCLGLALAVVGHKWAEALTLGISFRKSNIELKKGTIMIAIQAIMNPIGVGLGWIMSNEGDLITGIFTSISVGTFIYIACMEVIIEEFSMKRYKWLKFGIFLLSIGFVCLLWVFEQLAS